MTIAEPSPAALARAAYDDAVERNRQALASGGNLPVGQGALDVLRKRADAAAAAEDS